MIKYQANSSLVIMSGALIFMTTVLQSIEITRRNLMVITLGA